MELYQKWLHNFLSNRQLATPDGRPLYAYHCRTQEYNSLELILSSVRVLDKYYSFSKLHIIYPGIDRLFVLYSSEWWRRNYTSGAWKWQPIFDSINWPELDLNTRGRIVQRGLSYWKRELIKQSGHREFLLTVACEGGLPINLVQKDTGYLRAYLRALLRDYGTYAAAGVDAVELAGIHLSYLPRSLQQHILQEIAGNLIQSVWELQSHVTDAKNPVGQLDQIDPTWRQKLPLVLEDDAANALINALLQQAKKIRSGAVSQLRIVRRLERIGESWRLQAELQLPETIEKEILSHELGERIGRGDRLELQMCWGENFTRVASLIQQGDHYNIYPLDPRRLHLRDDVKEEISCFVYERGQQLGHLPLPGGNGLSEELPLIFVDREGDIQSLELLGQGSISSRFPEVFVLATQELTKIDLNDDDSQIELVAESITINDTQAFLYKIRGKFSIPLDEAASCIIRTRQEKESAADYRFEGRRVYFAESRIPVFKGMPVVKRLFENTRIQKVPDGEFTWSKISGKRNWRCVADTPPRGLIELRHVQNGECLLSRRLIVLPEETEIRLVPANKSNAGTIELHNIQTHFITWQNPEECQIEKNDNEAWIVLQFKTQKAVTGRINVKIAWPDGCECELALPFPIAGGRFIAPDDRVMKNHESMGLEHLPGFAAMALSLHGKCAYSLHGKLNAKDVSPEIRSLDFNIPLPELDSEFGVAKLPLYQIYDRLKQLFNFSGDKDAIVALELLNRGRSEARINIRQFSLEFIFDAESQTLSIEPKDARIFSELTSEPIELMPLFDPEEESQFLALQQPDVLSWVVEPEILQKGPWLAVAPESIRRYCRPCVIPPHSSQIEIPTSTVNLTEIVCEANSHTRKQAMQTLFETMAEDLKHDQWPVLLSYIRRFEKVHPDCLDWIGVASENPRILIGILLMGGAALFETVYEWEEYLPFKWWMLPIHDWKFVIGSYLSIYDDQEDVAHILSSEIERTLRRIDERNDTCKICLEYLILEIFHGRPKTHAITDVQNHGVDKSWELLEQITRHTILREKSESKWPEGVNREDWKTYISEEHQAAIHWLNVNNSFQRAVFDAPIATAYFSVTGIYPRQSHRVFLSAFREFHPEWFDTAFRAAQAIFLNQFDMGNRHE